MKLVNFFLQSEVKLKVELSREKCLEQLQREKEERDGLEGEINEVIFRLETLFKSNTKFQKVNLLIVFIYNSH